ncbi:DgyrCDS9805 [Dimorphilus gyrociliatus]|uniref:chitin synthase n=1 Tax=Dimorphilus gyrociliatus TaxID=2664684 RepID=A0A7I8VY30_9ANNE|nr:DgyrCDS9805 [Dimorphilus gyrociliatus]
MSQSLGYEERDINNRLAQNFQDGNYYECLNDLLIFTNPFIDIEFKENNDDRYLIGGNFEREPDHINLIVARSLKTLLESKENQSIVISGESGSGKGEIFQKIINQLNYIASKQDFRNIRQTRNLRQLMLKANELVDVFGTAKTPKNKNSTRFTKMFNVFVDGEGLIKGSFLNVYLLEKSRLIEREEGHFNFHIFYWILAGLSDEEKENFHLEEIKNYRILQNFEDQPQTLSTEEEKFLKGKFNHLIETMKILNLDDDDKGTIFAMISAVLNLTNIKFEMKNKNGSSDLTVCNNKYFRNAANLLGISIAMLRKVLLADISLHNPSLFFKNTLEMAEYSRDSLAKTIYCSLFDWIVNRVNSVMAMEEDLIEKISGKLTETRPNMISLFNLPSRDGKGEKNGFEQLICNSLNEELHSFYTESLIEDKKRQYEEDREIYNPSERIVDGKLKALHLLQMFWLIVNNHDQGLKDDYDLIRQMISKASAFPRQNYFTVKRPVKTSFTILHHFGEVLYDAEGYLLKNVDYKCRTIKGIFEESNNPFIQDIFTVPIEDTGNIKIENIRSMKMEVSNTGKLSLAPMGKSILKYSSENDNDNNLTIGNQFSNSIAEIMKLLKISNPYFVKCIKTNDTGESEMYDEGVVDRQLKDSLIRDIDKLYQQICPISFSFINFSKRYHHMEEELAENFENSGKDEKAFTKDCMSYLEQRGELDKNDYWLGRKRVYLQTSAYTILETLLHSYERRNGPSSRTTHLISRRLTNRKTTEQTRLIVAKKRSSFRRRTKRARNARNIDNRDRIDEETESMLDKLNNIAEPTLANTSKDECEAKNEKLPWDKADIIQSERTSASENFNIALKGLKVVMYVLLFICTLGGIIWSSLGLLWMTSNLNKNLKLINDSIASDEAKIEYERTWSQLLLFLCIPPFFSGLISFAFFLFGDKSRPKIKVLLFLVCLELLDAVGQVLLATRILPIFSSLSGIGLLYSVSLFPSFLKILPILKCSKNSQSPQLHNDGDNNRVNLRVKIYKAFDILAFMGQLLCTIFPLISIGLQLDFAVDADNLANIWMPLVSLLFCSFKIWENFVDFFDPLRGALIIKRNISNMVLCLCHITFVISFGILFEFTGPGIVKSFSFHPFADTKTYVEIFWTPAISMGIGAALAYYTGSLAIKTKMQYVSYSVPVTIATPLLVVFVILQTNGYIPAISSGSFEIKLTNFDMTGLQTALVIIFILVAWISTLWIGRHIWHKNTAPLAKREDIFALPLYNMITINSNLILNKRREDHHKLDKLKKNANEKEKNPTAEEEEHFAGIDQNKRRRFLSATDELPQLNEEQAQQPGQRVKKVYACATMWHENRNEMMQIMKSVFRMDKYLSIKREEACKKRRQNQQGTSKPKKTSSEEEANPKSSFYEFETHILFDDAMKKTDDGKIDFNEHVVRLMDVMKEAQNSVCETSVPLEPPKRIETPYGGRLVYKLIGKTMIYVHLKDRDKIRRKKRWSQVMYMYYLLCFKICGLKNDEDTARVENDYEESKGRQNWRDMRLPSEMTAEQKDEAEQTFILALDGDVDFKPEAVTLLVNRMTKNEKTGAACGRIHPIGSGPMTWYQIFEYAIGHWFQKSTEHVLGSVLCSPGCFSLFRGSSLLSNNVLRKYASVAEEPVHHIQWDQGEDRWLCTLLIQAGFRVDYTAASDALTFCPESFKEFFLQRRRWMPSTLANIFDLLSDSQSVRANNQNISPFYILYQFFLMISTILGPSTILLSIAAAFTTVFPKWDLWVCYGVALGPAVFYIAVCFKCKNDTQILIGGLLSTLYTSIMLIVLVSIIQSATRLSEINPSLVFIVAFAVAFIFAGIVHPQEVYCLAHGILYFLTIPSGYLILVIYSMCNLHVTSWGTRESKTPEVKTGTEDVKTQSKKKFFGIFSRVSVLNDIKDIINQLFTSKTAENQSKMIGILSSIHADMKSLLTDLPRLVNSREKLEAEEGEAAEVVKAGEAVEEDQTNIDTSKNNQKNDTATPVAGHLKNKWINVRKNEKELLNTEEEIFWTKLIEKYLKPLNPTKEESERVRSELLDLRNQVGFGMWLANGLWVLFNYMLQADTSLRPTLWGGYKFQPAGLAFMLFFALVLILQLCGMIKHRWGTFLQLLSMTKLRGNGKAAKKIYKKAIKVYADCYRANNESHAIVDNASDQDEDELESNGEHLEEEHQRNFKMIYRQMSSKYRYSRRIY